MKTPSPNPDHASVPNSVSAANAVAAVSAVTAVIAEDESVLLAELREMLTALWPELHVAAVAEDGVQALRALQSYPPQMLFLDIEMPGLTGLEVAAQASQVKHVVFVTAYDKYAVGAFEQGAIDYVIKPFSMARLATTVARLKARVSSPPADLDGLLASLRQGSLARKPPLRGVKASQGQQTRLITVDEVMFFQADNKDTVVITAEGGALIRATISELAAALDPLHFWQIHRSTIVNANEVAAVQRGRHGSLVLRLKRHKTLLSVSEPSTHLFKQM